MRRIVRNRGGGLIRSRGALLTCCCGPQQSGCAYAYSLCDPDFACTPDAPWVWVTDTALRSIGIAPGSCDGGNTAPPFIVYGGYCRSGPRAVSLIENLPPDALVVYNGVSLSSGCQDPICQDPSRYVLAEPCGCNEPQPDRPVYVCAALIPVCKTLRITVPYGAQNLEQPFCFNVRPGAGVLKGNVADGRAVFIGNVSLNLREYVDCCLCCGDVFGNCGSIPFEVRGGCGPDGSIANANLSGPVDACCVPYGRSTTILNFSVTRADGTTAGGSGTRIDNIPENGSVSSAAFGTWFQSNPFLNEAGTYVTQITGAGPEIYLPAFRSGCVGNISWQQAYDYFYQRLIEVGQSICPAFPNPCQGMFLTASQNSAYASFSWNTIAQPGNVQVCRVSGSLSYQWAPEGRCSGGCPRGSTLTPTQPGTGGADPDGIGPQPITRTTPRMSDCLSCNGQTEIDDGW